MRKYKQATGAALLAYASFVTWRCPCNKINSCHLKEFFWSVGAAVALVVYDNYG